MLTKNNYEQIKQDILTVIIVNIDYQIKFLDIFLKKQFLIISNQEKNENRISFFSKGIILSHEKVI